LGPARGWARESAGTCGLTLDQIGAQLPHVETMTPGESFFGFACFGDDWVRIHVGSINSSGKVQACGAIYHISCLD
jgi:hypothetical protein